MACLKPFEFPGVLQIADEPCGNLLFPQACRTVHLCRAMFSQPSANRAFICHHESQLTGNSPQVFDDDCYATLSPSIDLCKERNMSVPFFIIIVNFAILLMQLLRDGMYRVSWVMKNTSSRDSVLPYAVIGILFLCRQFICVRRAHVCMWCKRLAIDQLSTCAHRTPREHRGKSLLLCCVTCTTCTQG